MTNTSKESSEVDEQQCDWEITSVCSYCMTDFAYEETLAYTKEGFIDEQRENNQVLFVYVPCRVDDFMIVFCRSCYDLSSMNGLHHRNINICCGKCYEIDKIAPSVNVLEHL